MKIKNDRYLKALYKEKVDCTPVWMMRQAGRYLPEYQKVRKQAGDFMSLCKNPELACEVTLQPLNRFDLDAVILFSDILTIPDAMGLGLKFISGVGPVFENPIIEAKQIYNLPIIDPEIDLNYVTKAIKNINIELQNKVPLIGFTGSPWTLACYMVEGGSSKTWSKIKKLMYQAPELLYLLLDKISDAVILYLKAQISAGVNSLMIFDSWGGVLAFREFENFSKKYMQKIVTALQNYQTQIPITLFSKGAGLWLSSLAETNCNALGVDWTVNLANARKEVGEKVTLQGNLDPHILFADQKTIENNVKQILEDFGAGSGHIFNLGHGILPNTPIENVQIFIDAVHKFSSIYHS